jgi:hypothetical protein
METNREPRDALTREVAALRDELARINAHRIMRVEASTARVLAMQFARGLAFGLGSVMGATILVSVLVYLLSGIDFIPIVGEWAAEIARTIQLDSGQ